MQIAQDTFVAVLNNGTERFVAKGEVLPDSHELVKRDTNHVLFRKLDTGEDEKPPAKPARASRAAAKAAQ